MKNFFNKIKPAVKIALAVVGLLVVPSAYAQTTYYLSQTNGAFYTNGIQAGTTNTTYNTNIASSATLGNGATYPLNIYRQSTLPVYAQFQELTNDPTHTVIGVGNVVIDFAISPDGILWVTDPNYILTIPLTVPGLGVTNVTVTGWTNWASTSTTSPFPAQYIKVASVANTATNINGTNLVLAFFIK